MPAADLERARRRLEACHALATNESAALGERRNARVRIAEILANHPELEEHYTRMTAPVRPAPAPHRPGPAPSSASAQRRGRAARARGAPRPPTPEELEELAELALEELRHQVAPLLRDFLGLRVGEPSRFVPWIDDY